MVENQKTRFNSTYRYNFRTKQKLEALRATGLFNDNTEIIETGIDLLYERLLVGILDECIIDIIVKQMPELTKGIREERPSSADKAITKEQFEHLDPLYKEAAEMAIRNGRLHIAGK